MAGRLHSKRSMGIILPSQEGSVYIPTRLEVNWSTEHQDCYARYWIYPKSVEELGGWIEDAFQARTNRAHLIRNSQDMMKYNSKCLVCGITH